MHDPLSVFSAIFLTLFFVIDALGHIPTFLQLLEPYSPKERLKITIRELFFALGLMIVFHYLGELLLSLLGINTATVQLAGGIMLFLIAIRLIFANENEKTKWGPQKIFFVPIATPIIAGPSVLAIIMVFAQKETSTPLVMGAIFTAWFLSSLIFLGARPIYQLVKEKGLDACQRLMGLIVALIAVQLVLEGIAGVFK